MVLMSALPPLVPELILIPSTGKVIPFEEYERNLNSLTTIVQQETQRLWVEGKNTLENTLTGIKTKNPAEAGRQAGLKINLNLLPREVKAKSRVERLVRYNLVVSARSFFESPVLTKREPVMVEVLNLGAVDAQMATLRLEDSTLILTFKCWTTEYELHFTLPSYLKSRDIVKFTLPVIRRDKNGEWVHQFSIVETPKPIITNPLLIAGVDLGRVEPFTLAIVHIPSRNMVAQYTASKRLKILTVKRDRLNIELGYLLKKTNAHKALGIVNLVLEKERVLTRSKRNRLLNSITWQVAAEVNSHIVKHSPSQLNLENLSWVNPKHGMSRWTHSKDQTAITHKLTRSSIRVKKVNPNNTSQSCSKCGEKIVHHAGTRKIVCSTCSLTLNRDVNASVNIALKCFPLLKRCQGFNSTIVNTMEVKVLSVPNKTVLPSSTYHMVRKTR